ncbi:hypothetical protein JB92DRAFT_2942890 [Gautieria morchelliformis]|nr:hypothetical protein JB92DRAFT_2942890 [Gautieria morchelliformis]
MVLGLIYITRVAARDPLPPSYIQELLIQAIEYGSVITHEGHFTSLFLSIVSSAHPSVNLIKYHFAK